MRGERGFALLGVMLVVALLTVVVLELSVAMRLEASAGRSFREDLLASHLAEAAVQQALREVVSQAPIQAVDETGALVFYRVVPGSTLPMRLPSLPRARVPLGSGEFGYRLTDEEARLNLNTASPARVGRLLQALGLDRRVRDVVVDSLQDWKDADELPRANGAESEDFYMKLPVPYRARNARMQDPAELLQIRGVTRELYLGRDERPGLAELTTVFGRDAVNLNTAPAPVLAALGLSDAEITDVVQTRTRAPYTVVPGRFAGRGLGVGSATFRIEAEGWVAGAPKARIVAIVQRGTPSSAGAGPDDLAALGLAILSWRVGGDR
jgi:general secretion pathway protein K